MHKAQRQVEEFHRKCGILAPTHVDSKFETFPAQLRINLINEEAQEFAEAVSQHDLVATIDAICDLLYVTYGAAVSLGIDIEGAFDLIHANNLTKAGGPPRADGKLMKPPNYQPVDLTEWLAEQKDLCILCHHYHPAEEGCIGHNRPHVHPPHYRHGVR